MEKKLIYFVAILLFVTSSCHSVYDENYKNSLPDLNPTTASENQEFGGYTIFTKFISNGRVSRRNI